MSFGLLLRPACRILATVSLRALPELREIRIDEAGLPAGVFNLVTGLGPVVGEALAAGGSACFLRDGWLVYANKACQACFGLDPADLGEVDFLKLVDEGYRREIDDLLSSLKVDRPTDTREFPVNLEGEPQPWHRWTIRSPLRPPGRKPS